MSALFSLISQAEEGIGTCSYLFCRVERIGYQSVDFSLKEDSSDALLFLLAQDAAFSGHLEIPSTALSWEGPMFALWAPFVPKYKTG